MDVGTGLACLGVGVTIGSGILKFFPSKNGSGSRTDSSGVAKSFCQERSGAIKERLSAVESGVTALRSENNENFGKMFDMLGKIARG